MKVWAKRLVWLAILILIGVGLQRAFKSAPVLVDVADIARGQLIVTVDDDGRTRVRDRYTISAPTDGRLLRPPLEAGAVVRAQETVLAEFEARAPSLLDARARAQAEARVERAQAVVEEAKAMVSKADADLRFSQADLERKRGLVERGAVTQQVFDLAERDEHRASEGARAARFAVQVAEHELRLAQAGLLDDADGAGSSVSPLLSPIDGQVIRVLEESARTIPAGTPILEIGDISLLEVVADFLSQDAVKVQPGMEVLVEGWGGDLSDAGEEILYGRVRLVEPGGFTKVSALGVEEQRVNVIVDPDAATEDWARLHDGYRVELRIVIWKTDDVILVPTGALFRDEASWAVFVIESELAQRREVSLGRRNGLEAEVVDGLAVGERVVLYPSELIEEGTRVDVR